MERLIVNGYDLADYGVFISRKQKHNAPKRRFTTITVPGRSGDLVQDDNSWENIKVTYDCYIQTRAKDILPYIKELIMRVPGYLRIEDTINPYEYRLGIYSEGLDDIDTSIFIKQAKFTLTFNCKPQRFLKSGEDIYLLRNVENSESAETEVKLNRLHSPSLYPCNPLFIVKTDSNKAYIRTGGKRIDFTADNQTLYIDTETLDCIDEIGNNANDKVVFSFDEPLNLTFKGNDIYCSSNVTQFRVKPRWFML